MRERKNRVLGVATVVSLFIAAVWDKAKKTAGNKQSLQQANQNACMNEKVVYSVLDSQQKNIQENLIEFSHQVRDANEHREFKGDMHCLNSARLLIGRVVKSLIGIDEIAEYYDLTTTQAQKLIDYADEAMRTALVVAKQSKKIFDRYDNDMTGLPDGIRQMRLEIARGINNQNNAGMDLAERLIKATPHKEWGDLAGYIDEKAGDATDKMDVLLSRLVRAELQTHVPDLDNDMQPR